MSMLHTVNKSPFNHDTLASCLKTVQLGAAVVLIEDGVYAAREGTKVSSDIKTAMKKIKVYALAPDLSARGVNENLIEGIEQIDYAGFVDLTTKHDTVQSWL